jgi:N-acetylglucosaminyldiphosphoundecaprenol N-acetyl-beta-D-mannosaminyltransferase
VLGTFIDATSWNGSLSCIHEWVERKESRYVCACNVHSVVTTRRHAEFKKVVAEADLATPDGAPVAWMLRRLGHSEQQRIDGPTLMWRYCALAERFGKSVYLLGSTPSTLRGLVRALAREFPRLRIAGVHSPPFRPTTKEEDDEIVERINASGAGVVFVSLGCPKQELWMAGHRGRVRAVMIGVGCAFDYHAGTVSRAPPWMQRSGLEWLHRLCSEPTRLWRRYLITNTLFLVGAAAQLGRRRLSPLRARRQKEP